MRILAIDPGTTESAYVVYDSETGDILAKAKLPNQRLSSIVGGIDADTCVIEMIASYGMAVGREVFETCVWVGRFAEIWDKRYKRLVSQFVYRKDVKMCLCGTTKAKDANIRQAIIDRYPPGGGGKLPQVGVKANQGPLYGVSKDIWAAIGVAITYAETVGNG